MLHTTYISSNYSFLSLILGTPIFIPKFHLISVCVLLVEQYESIFQYIRWKILGYWPRVNGRIHSLLLAWCNYSCSIFYPTLKQKILYSKNSCNIILIVKLTSGYIREKNSIQYDSYLYSNNFLSSESCKILSTHKYIINSSGINTIAYSSSGTNIVVSNVYSSSGTNFIDCYAHKFMRFHVIECLSRI